MKYRKRPIAIDAWQFNGSLAPEASPPAWLLAAVKDGGVWRTGHVLCIDTLEGVMRCGMGDWVIRGVAGELYPCKAEIFAATYEAVGE